MRLKDKIALVTAATRGIGACIAREFAREGAIVYIGARRMDAAEKMADELNAKGLNVHAVYNDAEKHETYQSMIDTVVSEQGRIDVLVNNFGGSNPKIDKDICSTKYEDFINVVDKTLASVFLASQSAIPHMSEGGSIINISSLSCSHPDVSQIGYGTSKAAVNYMTKLIATHTARKNIRCNAVAPGMTATDAVKNNLTDDFQDFFLRHTPIRRMASPEEIAHACTYFASDESAFVTGQLLEVAGGFGMPTPVFADTLDAGVSR